MTIVQVTYSKQTSRKPLFSMNILNQSKSHPGRRGGGGRLTPIWEIGDARRKIRVKLLKETILSVTQTKGAFQKSELADRAIAGPVILTMKFQEFLLKHHFLRAR